MPPTLKRRRAPTVSLPCPPRLEHAPAIHSPHPIPLSTFQETHPRLRLERVAAASVVYASASAAWGKNPAQSLQCDLHGRTLSPPPFVARGASGVDHCEPQRHDRIVGNFGQFRRVGGAAAHNPIDQRTYETVTPFSSNHGHAPPADVAARSRCLETKQGVSRIEPSSGCA